jgi:hypothetical protein
VRQLVTRRCPAGRPRPVQERQHLRDVSRHRGAPCRQVGGVARRTGRVHDRLPLPLGFPQEPLRTGGVLVGDGLGEAGPDRRLDRAHLPPIFESAR